MMIKSRKEELGLQILEHDFWKLVYSFHGYFENTKDFSLSNQTLEFFFKFQRDSRLIEEVALDHG